MTAIVLDASVAVKLVSQESDSDIAAERVASASAIFAPDWIMIEVLHALWKKDHASPEALETATAAVVALTQMIDRIVPARDLMSDALTSAHQLPHPIYDCLYLALGRIENAVVLTADSKFALIVEQAGCGSEIERLEAH
jgi:predicted nucleic acid-binding protein